MTTHRDWRIRRDCYSSRHSALSRVRIERQSGGDSFAIVQTHLYASSSSVFLSLDPLFPPAMLLVIGMTRSPVPSFYKSREKRSVRVIRSNIVLRPRGPDAMPRLAAPICWSRWRIGPRSAGSRRSAPFCIEMYLSRNCGDTVIPHRGIFRRNEGEERIRRALKKFTRHKRPP